MARRSLKLRRRQPVVAPELFGARARPSLVPKGAHIAALSAIGVRDDAAEELALLIPYAVRHDSL